MWVTGLFAASALCIVFEETRGGKEKMGRSVEKKGFWLVDSHCTGSLLAPLRDAYCFSQVLAAGVSCSLLIGGCIVRLPQLLKIYRARSVAGLSELSVYVEALSPWIFVSYNVLQNHPLMTWGEMIPVAVTNLLILLLFWKFRPSGETRRATTRSMSAAQAVTQRSFSAGERKAAAFSLISLTALVLYMRLFMTKNQQFYRILSSALGLSPVPLLLLAKIPQIKQNAEQKHTGQLSAGSLAMMALGNLARVCTTLLNLSDRFVLLTCALACTLNTIPLIQIMWYRRRTEELLKQPGRPVSRSRGKVKAA